GRWLSLTGRAAELRSNEFAVVGDLETRGFREPLPTLRRHARCTSAGPSTLANRIATMSKKKLSLRTENAPTLTPHRLASRGGGPSDRGSDGGSYIVVIQDPSKRGLLLSPRQK